jgi:glycerophosphoryl diester phosphodiesterase
MLLKKGLIYSGERGRIAFTVPHFGRYLREGATPDGGLVEKRLVEMLAEFGWTGPDAPVRIMSFSFTALQRVQRLAPDMQLVMLIDKAHHWPMLRRLVDPDWIIGPGIKELKAHPGFGRRLQESGRRIHVWTVNTKTNLEICQSLGVEAVISDKPDTMLRLLGRK